MKILLTWLISALALLLSSWLLPGVEVRGFGVALLAAIILGAVNAVIRPIILIFTLPINILTLGLFTLIINASMVLLVAALIPGFSLSSFGVAIIFSVILSLITWTMETLIKGK